jgi:hypothetical protein
MLTYYAVVEEPPKEDSEYDETRMVLQDHLRPNCPVKEARVRWMPKPPAAEYRYTFRRNITGDIRVYTLFHEPMTFDFFVRHHVGEVGRGLDHSHSPQCLTCKHYYDSWTRNP